MTSQASAEHAEKLEQSYASFVRTLSLLDPEERTQPCLHRGWTPIALVAHVAFWDDFQRRRMEAALTGAWAQRVPWPQEDNDARAAAEARDWEAVMAEADAARRALVDFARTVTPQQTEAVYREDGKERPVLQILLRHMVKHAREHAEEVMRYCGSLDRWGRDRLRHFLFQQQESFLDGISGLSEETVTTVPICGAWTVRDVLAHVLAWDEYAQAVVEQWPAPERSSLAGWIEGEHIDAINARLQAQKAGMTMIDLLDGLATVHRRLLSKFDRASDEELRSEGDYGLAPPGSLSGFLYWITLHTADHAADIYAARAAGLLQPARVTG